MRNFLLMFCIGATALLANGAAFANDELIQLSKDPKQWVMPTGDYANRRYSKLDQINSDNVKRLAPVWSFSTGVLRGHEGGPLVIGHVMYFSTPFPNIVYALDLNHDGKILWKYEPKQDPNVIPVMCCDTVNRGVAYGDGKIFLHQADTTLVALDAQTGAVVWSVKNGDPSRGETGTSAPQVVKDKVLVGISGGEFGVRGSITAYDIKTGKKAWRGYSMGPDSDTLIDPVKTTSLGKPVGPDSGTNTWQGDQWKIGGGATWGWISFDPELNLVYYGSGNPSTWNSKQRPGDNRWSMTVWARDADTGFAKWVYQLTPHDEWDYDGVNEMILANQETRKVLVHFDRNGFGYTLDRETGEPLVAEKFDPAVNWATRVDLDKNSKTYGRPLVAKEYSTEVGGEDVNTRGICPAALGSKDEQPAAYSPETGLFYIPANHVCMDYEPFHVSYTAGQPYVGATLSMYPPKGESNMGNFTAWDAKTGKIVWQKKELFSVWSGALATAGNLVFYGTLEGYLKAVDAKTGEELYKFKTPSGIIGNVTTYEHNGRQYVAVLSGVGGWAGIGIAAGLTRGTEGLGAVGGYAALSNYTALGGQLTVFALSGSVAEYREPIKQTVRDFLKRGENEPDNLGLYSYLLFGSAGDSDYDLKIAAIKAYLSNFNTYKETGTIKSGKHFNGFFVFTREDAEWIDQCDRTNFVLSILTDPQSPKVPAWSCFRQKKSYTIDELAQWVVPRLDYPRAQELLGKLHDIGAMTDTNGIYIISYLASAVKESSVNPAYVLVQDLSKLPPNYMASWVELTAQQFTKPDYWDKDTFEYAILSIRTTLAEIAPSVELTEKALASELVKGIFRHK